MLSPVKIDEELYRKLIKSHNEMEAINTMMQMFQDQCQKRMVQAKEEAQKAWQEIAQKHAVDIFTVDWQVDFHSPRILPVQMRITGN